MFIKYLVHLKIHR